MSHERCRTCDGVLVWAVGRLVCPRPACPGHTDLRRPPTPRALARPAGLGPPGEHQRHETYKPTQGGSTDE